MTRGKDRPVTEGGAASIDLFLSYRAVSGYRQMVMLAARLPQPLGRALAAVREPWEPASTANNLKLIREARERRDDDAPAWAAAAENELLSRAAQV
jgi:hypothetical protein